MTFCTRISTARKLPALVLARHIALVRLHLVFVIYDLMYLPRSDWQNNLPNPTNTKTAEARWEALWRIFASSPSRTLVLEVLDHGVEVLEEVLLAPLRNLRGKNAEVLLPWPEGLIMSGDFDEADFTVTRPKGRELMLMFESERGGYPGVRRRRGFMRRLRWR
jgi:hypothetical protein